MSIAIQRKASSIHEIFEASPDTLAKTPGPGVLVTLVHTEGSCYQKAGAQLYLDPVGRAYGLVSGGCLEQSILEAAHAVLSGDGAARIETYDSRGPDDIDFGYGMGCGGKLWILFERVEHDSDLASKVLGPTRQGHSELIVVAADDPAWIGRRSSLLSHYDQPTWLATPVPHLEQKSSALFTAKTAAGASITCALYHRPARMELAIFGAGPGSWPLASIARTLGWDVWVYDHRPQLLEDVPSHLARKILFSRDGDQLSWPSSPLRAAVLMTHSFAVDRLLLSHMLHDTWVYVGLMGSEQRCRTLLEALASDGQLSDSRFLHGPAGLALGGRDPASIALSIVSEIQMALYRGVPLRKQQEVSIHAAL